jgi:hypothetical protein
MGGLLNDSSTLLHAACIQPLLSLLRVIQMKTYQAITVRFSKLLLKLIPELLALSINP